MRMDNRFVIDPRRNGNEGRFINHSCEPNCDLMKVSILVEEQVVKGSYAKNINSEDDDEWGGKKRNVRKTRSVSKPITETKVISHVRLGVFSKRDIEANEELSFD